MGQEVLAKRLVVDCFLEFEGNYLSANLMILAMEDFDCIMGIDLLTKYRATVDCYQRLVQFRPEGDENWFFFGEGARPPMPVVSAVKAQRALAKGGEGYLIYVVDVSKDVIDVKNIPVVNEFPDVFPDEIPGFPPEREVEAEIELVPGTAPISRAPYRLAPTEMKELKQQLQDLLDKGFNELHQRLTTAPVLALPSGSGREAQFSDPKVEKLARLVNGDNTSGFAFQEDGTLCLSVGGETPDVAEDWLERMESCFRAFQCTEEQQMETLGFLLEGRARKWWRSTSAPIVQSQGRVTWAEFRAAFMQLYFPPALRQAKTIELLNLKQGSMSVDAYQQKFFELLPFAPHISGSSEAKYDHFLQGLNQEIFDRVTVCDNPTSYDGLVNRCRQAEISLQRGRSILSSRPPNTLSPRSQSFKKSGSSSSGSGSRSSGVFRFGKKKVSCVHCGKNHPSEQCRSAAGACFQCGEMGHLKKNCPQLRGGAGSGSGSQTTVQQRTQGQAVGGSNLRPRAQGQVFALNQDQAADETGRVIAGLRLDGSGGGGGR
ncbi:uncharacterized protein [Primulina eburnea]|uniref:uncharacterized protein n=1 Tax=Primulina eburnea TaxID=1245227 RepID=UPI003C6BF6F1